MCVINGVARSAVHVKRDLYTRGLFIPPEVRNAIRRQVGVTVGAVCGESGDRAILQAASGLGPGWAFPRVRVIATIASTDRRTRGFPSFPLPSSFIGTEF